MFRQHPRLSQPPIEPPLKLDYTRLDGMILGYTLPLVL
jgi:hypothetical protein